MGRIVASIGHSPADFTHAAISDFPLPSALLRIKNHTRGVIHQGKNAQIHEHDLSAIQGDRE